MSAYRELARAHWDRIAAWFAISLGVLFLVAGWVGASGESLPAAQLPYLISGGLGGLLLVGVGAMLWLSADLRDEWRKLDELDERLASSGIGAPTGPEGPGGFAPVSTNGAEPVAVGDA